MNHECTYFYFHLDRKGPLWALTKTAGSSPRVVENVSSAISESDAPRRRARVIGFPLNLWSTLFSDLMELKRSGILDEVEICSPRCVPEERVRQGLPEEILWTAADWTFASSDAGRWRPATELDLTLTYMARWPDWRLSEPLYQHPLSSTLDFISGAGHSACARLMGAIHDPRWFIVPGRPGSVSRLSSFLGLKPRVQRGVAGLARPVYGHERCSLVLRAWKGDSAAHRDWKTDPGAFLWRIWDRYTPGWQADLKTSTKFIKFLFRTWLQQLGHSDGLFDPEEFFDVGEAAAFRDHLESRSLELTS